MLLGSPTQLLGFSDQKESHDRALEVCTDQQMSLAILDTLYEDVTTYIQEQHSARDEAYWWVAATRFDPSKYTGEEAIYFNALMMVTFFSRVVSATWKHLPVSTRQISCLCFVKFFLKTCFFS